MQVYGINKTHISNAVRLILIAIHVAPLGAIQGTGVFSGMHGVDTRISLNRTVHCNTINKLIRNKFGRKIGKK